MRNKKSNFRKGNNNAPVTGTDTGMVTQRLSLSVIDRSPKDRGILRSAHIVAESIAYPNRSRLLDIFEDVLLDPVVLGIIRKRISQVVNKRLLFRRSDQAVPEMDAVIKTKVFKEIMRQIIWTKMFGLNGLEFVPGPKLAFNLIPKKHIKQKTQLITREQFGLNEGIDYTKLSNVWILGEPNDLGLLLIVGYIVMLKKGAVSDWAQYIEIFGSPAIVLKYKGFDQQAKVAADRILAGIGNNMRITIPEEMGLTFEDGKLSNGDGKLHETFRQACNEEIAIALIGNTETTGHSKTGTGAKSEVHAQQQLELIKDDMDDICDLLNSDQFMNILRSYGLPVDGGVFEFDREIDMKALSEKYKIDIALLQAGLPIAKKYFYETYGIPEPKDTDDVIQLTPVTPSTGDPEDTEDAPKPKTRKKTPQALSKADISAMLDEKLTSFFGQPL